MSTKEEESIVYVIDSDPATITVLKALFCSVRIEAKYFDLADGCLARMNAKSYGCIIADTSSAGVSVTTLQRRLHDKGIEIPIIFLSYFSDVAEAIRAFKYGAADFLEKPFNGQTLLDTVHRAIEASHINAQRKTVRHELRSRFSTLTRREWEVLPWMIKGWPNRLIAGELEISEKTVEVYRTRIIRKVGVASLPELIRIAIQIDLLDELAQRSLSQAKPPHRPNRHYRHPTTGIRPQPPPG